MSLKINGELIEDEVIEDELHYVKGSYAKNNSPATSPMPKTEELLLLVKENIVRKTVLRQEAEKIFLPISEQELKDEIENYKHRNNRPRLSPQEESYMRQHFSNLKKIKHLISEVIKDLDEPTAEHLKIFYRDNQKHYFLEQGYDFFEIGVAKATSENNADLEKNKTINEAFSNKAFSNKALGDKINNFKKKFSPIPGYEEEIKKALGLGSYAKEWKLFPHLDLNPLIQEKLSLLHPHETTPVQEEKSAFYFLYLAKVYHNYQPSFLEVKEKVRKDLKFELEERKIDIYVEKLMQKSEIIDEKFI